jgi:hypothetical protein
MLIFFLCRKLNLVNTLIGQEKLPGLIEPEEDAVNVVVEFRS